MKKFFTHRSITLIFSAILLLPLLCFAEEKPETVFTIQIATHNSVDTAIEEFDELSRSLPENARDYLRVEKIGKYYPIRLGRFKARQQAEEMLNTIRTYLPSAIVRDAYFIEKRIVKMHKPSKEPVVEHPEKEEAIVQKPPVKKEPAPEKTPAKEPLEKRIAELVDKQKFAEALEIVKVEIANQPDNASLNAWYGTILLKMNQPTEALEYLQNAVAISPDVPDYHNVTGYCLFFLNEMEKAIDEFKKAVSLDPEHIDALTGLGIIYAQRGEFDNALSIYDRLKELDSNTANKLLKIIESKTL
jgi:tetratricopeptide (TPR) repeat protein